MLTERWQRNLAAIWLAQTLTMIAFSFVFPFIPLYVQELGVEDPQLAAQWAGLISAASALSMAVSQPFWGNMADRWGRRPMVIRSMLGGAVVVALMGFATTPEHLVVVRLLQGTVTGTQAASNALVATSTPKHRLGFALGMLQVAVFLGNSFGPLVGGVVADTFGYRIACYGAGALMLIGGVVVMGLVQENFTPPSATTPQRGVLNESKALLSIPALSAMLAVIFMIQAGGTIIAPVLSLFVAELNGADNAATAAGMILAASGAISAISALVLGRIGDRVGHTRILTICLAGAAISCIPQAFVHQVWELLALRMVLGAFLGGLMPTANALLAAQVPQERRGAVFGLAATANAMSNGLGPLSGAGIAAQWGFRAVFMATGVLFAIAFGWVTLGLRRYQVPTPRPQVAIPAQPPLDADSRDTV